MNYVGPSDLQKKFDILSSKLSTDSNFARSFVTDFEYAKLESAKFGLDINLDLYQQLVDNYSKLEATSLDFVTFEDGWQNPMHKPNRSNVTRLTRIIILSCILGASIGGLFILKRFHRVSHKK